MTASEYKIPVNSHYQIVFPLRGNALSFENRDISIGNTAFNRQKERYTTMDVLHTWRLKPRGIQSLQWTKHHRINPNALRIMLAQMLCGWDLMQFKPLQINIAKAEQCTYIDLCHITSHTNIKYVWCFYLLGNTNGRSRNSPITYIQCC